MPGRLRAQVEFMRSRPEIVLAGSFVYHMGADRSSDRLVELPMTPRQVAASLQRENCLYHPAVILRRSTVLAAGGYREEFRNAEDYELWLRLARRHDLANIAQPLLRYRFSVSGMTLGRKWEQLRYVRPCAGDASRTRRLARRGRTTRRRASATGRPPVVHEAGCIRHRGRARPSAFVESRASVGQGIRQRDRRSGERAALLAAPDCTGATTREDGIDSGQSVGGENDAAVTRPSVLDVAWVKKRLDGRTRRRRHARGDSSRRHR